VIEVTFMNPEMAARANVFFGEQENEQHARAIQKLAQELHLPHDEIERCYTAILDVLKKDAKVKAFLPVLVSRSVKERLQNR